MTIRKTLSFLLSILMAVSVFGGLSLTADAADLTISTAAQLRTFLTNVANGTSYAGQTVVMSGDIDLGNQNMSGVQNNANNAFRGTFDGQNHIIRNFSLSASGAYWGLFRYTSNGAVIKNLNFVNANVSSNADDVGIVVGYANDTLTMNNVHVRSGSVSGSSHVGGLVGIFKEPDSGSLNMSYCSNAASVRGGYAGGLVGYSESKVGETFEQCYNVGSVTCTSGGTGGGLFGYFNGDDGSNADWVWFKQCFNAGTVSGGKYMGGIIGYVEDTDNSEFDQCFNWGNVSSSYMAGGIFSGIGDNAVSTSYGKLDYINTGMYNAGTISAGSGYAYDIGWSSATDLNRCYNCGTISATNVRKWSEQKSASQISNGASMISSAQLVTNTWGVKIGSTTFIYPIHSWYRNLFTFESKFVDSESGTNTTITKIYNNSFTTPSPTRTGYNRSGNWFSSSSQLTPGGSYTAGITSPMNGYVVTEGIAGPWSTVTYDLNWTAINYYITYNTDGGEAISQKTYTIESTDKLPGAVKTGHTFDHWTATSGAGAWTVGNTYNKDTSLTGKYGNATLKANWTINTSDLRIDPKGGAWAGTSELTTITRDYGEVYTPGNPTPPVGYHFTGWTLVAASLDEPNGSWENGSYTFGPEKDVLDVLEATYAAHTYTAAPTWSDWTENGGAWTCTATFTCDGCSNTVSPEVTVTPAVTGPTCTEDGFTVYTASVTIDGATWTNPRTKTVAGDPATDHHYTGAPTWGEWTDGNTVAATFKCDDCDETITPEVNVTSAETDATCTAAGFTVYTASVTYNGTTYTNPQTKTVPGDPATGHTYAEPAEEDWTWTKSGDTYTATVDVSCVKGDDTQTLTASVALTDSENAGHLTDGFKTYTATATIGSQTFTATKTDVLTAEGHSTVHHAAVPSTKCTEYGTIEYWSCSGCDKLFADENAAAEITDISDHTYGPHAYAFDSFVWSADFTSAQAKYVCTNHSGHVELYDAAVTPDAHEPDCTHAGYTEYTADYDGNTETKRVAGDPATGHNYAEPAEDDWTWTKAGDRYTVTVDVSCVKGDDEQTLTASVALTDSEDAGHLTDGFKTYTATATIGSQTFTATKTDVLTAEGHSPVHHAAVPSTRCDEYGTIEYWSCAGCDKLFADENAATEITDISDHTYGPHSFTAQDTDEEYRNTAATCSAKATYFHSCEFCGAKGETTFESGEYDYDHHSTAERRTENAKEPGYTFKGYTGDEYCVACGHETQHGSEIDKLNINDNADVAAAKTVSADAAADPTLYDESDVTALNAKLADLDDALAIDNNEAAVLAIIAELKELVESMDAIVYYNVTFTVDGAQVKTEQVRAGGSATAPAEAEYINNGENHKHFSGWSGDYTNVTADITITATYVTEGHSWVDGEVTKEANCHEIGTQAQSCACGATNVKTLAIDKTRHVGGVGTRKEHETAGNCCTAPTWDEVTYCLGCGETLTSTPTTGTIDTNAHNWGDWTVKTPATCEDAGEEERVCANNPNHTETRPIEAKGHSYGAWTVKTPATCEEAGVEERVCANDANHRETREIPAKGHTFGAWTVTKPATCEEDGTESRICAACGKQEDRVIRSTGSEHKWGAWVETKAPTCAQAGEQTRTCAICGKTETRSVEKLSHQWGEWINDAGSEATCTSGGTQHRECAVCGEIETRDIPGGFGHHVANPNLRGEGYCEYCGEFVCNRCASLTQFEDLEIVGIFYRIVHFFIHFAHMISYHS